MSDFYTDSQRYKALNKTIDIQKDRIFELEDVEKSCMQVLARINHLNSKCRYEEARNLCEGFLSGIQKEGE